MVVTTIYMTRHGFRGNFTVDPNTGKYYTNFPSPTNIPSDPPLAAYGVRQAEQLATALSAIKDPPITHVYSSPFYRCLQTIQPFAEKSGLEVRGENGIGEWYGLAPFTQPAPASPSLLQTFFGLYNPKYKPSIIPSSFGEDLPTLHDRCAYALTYIISDANTKDATFSERLEKETSILVCTHAASLIAIGRALTGHMPKDACAEDFKTYTCGISKFVRRKKSLDEGQEMLERWEPGMDVPKVDWRAGKGVAGGWDCVINGDCNHLEGGEERGWYFHGDEIFNDPEIHHLGERRAKDIEVNDIKAVANPKL